MEIQDFLNYFSTYGLSILFLIVFLEYLNLPGLPAGIIMPAAGILVSRADLSFASALGVSVVAGVLGSLVLYVIGYYFGNGTMELLKRKIPKSIPSIEKTNGYIERFGNKGVFITRLIPVARTIISLVAGTFRMNLVSFTLYSTIGITIWNFVYIFAGYAFSDLFLG
ncbi:MAG: DedA family protein [Erysipelotrichaceae bacterium]